MYDSKFKPFLCYGSLLDKFPTRDRKREKSTFGTLVFFPALFLFLKQLCGAYRFLLFNLNSLNLIFSPHKSV